MKKIISLVLALVCVCSLFTVGTGVSAEDNLDTKFSGALSTLDHLYINEGISGYYDYAVMVVSNVLFKDCDNGAYEMTVNAKDYEAVLNSCFEVDDSLLEAVRNNYSIEYSEENGTYILSGYGGFGGILPDREYLGYKKVGDRYDVYFGHVTYGFLSDVLPEGVNEWEYAESLGYPYSIEYEGIEYESGPDGYFYIKSHDDFGIKYTVELNDDEHTFDVTYRSCLKFLRDVLPEGVEEDEYAASLGNPETIEYNGEVYSYSSWNGYYTYLDDGYLEYDHPVEVKGERVRIISYSDYTAEDLPESFDQFDSTEIFADLEVKSWSKEGIDYVVSHGYMDGSKGKFNQTGTMTRAMIVTVLWRIAGSPEPVGENPFKDLEEGQTWYHDAVIWAYKNKIVTGKSETTFDPTGAVTREQIATFLYRHAKYMGYDTSVTTDISKFPDADKVSSWATEALTWANAVGLVQGKARGDKDYLDPQGDATREQVATILMRFCKAFGVN